VNVNERFEEFGPGVDVALITFSDPKYLRSYRHRTGWHHPVLIDTERTVYRQFGYKRGSQWRVYGWKALRQYASIIRRDGVGVLDRATEDTLQLGGNAVIGPDGTTTWIYRGAGPDDRPTFDEILAEVRRAQAASSLRS
jgi:hypothetical protein